MQLLQCRLVPWRGKIKNAQDYERAIGYATKSLREDEELDARKLRWNDYVRGTSAFLCRDRQSLIHYRNQVAAGIGDYVGNENHAKAMDLLIENFDRSYADAYGGK